MRKLIKSDSIDLWTYQCILEPNLNLAAAIGHEKLSRQTKINRVWPYWLFEVAYPNYPLSLAEGEQLLTDAIRQFHGSIVQAKRGVKAGSTPLAGNVAIKAAAGLGKASQAISELCVGQVKY